MSRRLFGQLAAVGVAGLLCAPAMAQFTDDFEGYTNGQEPCGLNGWQEWGGGSADVCGYVTNEVPAHSGEFSLKIEGAVGGKFGFGDDTVRQFQNVTSGQWVFSVWTYVPAAATGTPYIILLNTYADPAGPFNWSLQVSFDADLDVIEADFSGEQTALIRDRWVEFRAEIDLDADLTDYYYDGVQFVFDKSWTQGVSGGGVARIAALDLYANEPPAGTTGMYFDNVSLVEAGGNDCPADCDLNDIVNSADVGCFLTIYFADLTNGTTNADCDNNGVTTSADVGCFLTLYFQSVGPCP